MQQYDGAVETAVPNALINMFGGYARPVERVNRPADDGGGRGGANHLIDTTERCAEKMVWFAVDGA